MATSGQVGGVLLQNYEVVEQAFRRCRMAPQTVGGEMLSNARRSLQVMLNALPNNVTALWARDQQVLGLTPGLRALSLPPGTTEVLSASLRSMPRFTGTATGNTIGVVTEPQDGTISSYITMPIAEIVTVNLGALQTICTVGVMLGAPTVATVYVETSADGAVWTTRATFTDQAFQAFVFAWVDLDPSIDTQYVRIREGGTDVLQLCEIFIGGAPSEIPITPCARDAYVSMPDATSRGRPIMYWLDKQASGPLMRLWPTPSVESIFMPLVIWRERQIQAPGEMTDTLEVPANWQEPIINALAYRIALDTPQVDPNVVQMLKPLADEYTMLAKMGTTERGPVTMSFGIGSYTR